jgi:hypothetical protein
MQMYTAKIRLVKPGDVHPVHEITRGDLSASDITMLRAVHGEDNILVSEDREGPTRKHADEVERIRGTYGPKAVAKVFGEFPRLPSRVVVESFSEAGEYEDIEFEEVILASEDKVSHKKVKNTHEKIPVFMEMTDPAPPGP